MWIVKMNMPLVLMSLVGGGMIVIVVLLKKIFGRFLPKRLFPLHCLTGSCRYSLNGLRKAQM